MDPHEDDRPLGVPVMKPRPKLEASPAAVISQSREHAAEPIDEGRHPEDELGLPRQMPSRMHAPTKEELEAIQTEEDLEMKRLYAEAMQATLGRFSKWGHFVDKTLLLIVLAILGLLALYAFSQALQITAALAAQPVLLKIGGSAVLATILVVLFVFAYRLLAMLRRLRVNQQISAAQFRALSRRAELRSLVLQDMSAAKTNLEAYLRSYPFPEGRLQPTLGFQADETAIKRLRDAKDFLLDRDRFSDYDGWLDDFQTRFQDTLQGEADRIVGNWMKLVGIKTAISPNGLIDSIIVLYCSYGMIGDLCRLYNLRMTRPGMIRLLALSLFNTYAAGQIEDHAEELIKMADLEPIVDAVSALGGELMKKYLGKVADGTANALLLRRLGRMTIAMLRPIEPQ